MKLETKVKHAWFPVNGKKNMIKILSLHHYDIFDFCTTY